MLLQSPFSWFCSQDMWGTQKMSIWVVKLLVGNDGCDRSICQTCLSRRTQEAVAWLVIRAAVHRTGGRGQGDRTPTGADSGVGVWPYLFFQEVDSQALGTCWRWAICLGGESSWNQYLVVLRKYQKAKGSKETWTALSVRNNWQLGLRKTPLLLVLKTHVIWGPHGSYRSI